METIHRETTVEWMKLKIRSMIWNIRKQKITTQTRKKNPKKMKSVNCLWDNFKCCNIPITGVPDVEEKE